MDKNVKIVAFHSFGDNLVNIGSSLISFCSNHQNLYVGIYVDGQQLINFDSIIGKLMLIYSMGINNGLDWHPLFVKILSETKCYSQSLIHKYVPEMVAKYAATKLPDINHRMAHNEAHSCQQLYLYSVATIMAQKTKRLKKKDSYSTKDVTCIQFVKLELLFAREMSPHLNDLIVETITLLDKKDNLNSETWSHIQNNYNMLAPEYQNS